MQKISKCSLLVFSCLLAACGGQPIVMPAATAPLQVSSPTDVPAPTLVPITATPTPMTVPLIPPDAVQMEFWKQYEAALGAALLPPNSSRGEVLCEWNILERSNQQVYVWAFCQSPPYSETLPPSMASVPAVIELDANGMPQSVKTPGSGSAYAADIRRLFPADIQNQIFSHSIDTSPMEAHINFRREHPEPPLIILSAATPPP